LINAKRTGISILAHIRRFTFGGCPVAGTLTARFDTFTHDQSSKLKAHNIEQRRDQLEVNSEPLI